MKYLINRRIVVIQYCWVLQSFTRDLIVELARAGYEVDFFIDKRSLNRGFVDTETLNVKNLSIFLLNGPSLEKRTLFGRVVRRLTRDWNRAIGNPLWIFSQKDLNYVQDTVQRECAGPLLGIIGVDKLGLILAGSVGNTLNIPHFYWSLELVFPDNSSSKSIRALSELECRYHGSASGTIIQDESRKYALFKQNCIGRQPYALLPVAIPNLSPMTSTRYWNERYHLDPNQPIALYFGFLDRPQRCLEAIVYAWRNAERDHVLVLHGGGESEELRKICIATGLKNVFVSDSLVPESEIRTLVSSADSLICVYNNKNINDRLTAFSSQKIAGGLREGVPIISLRNESYDTLYSAFRCGEAISNSDELPLAFKKILSNHVSYKQEARRAFEAFYSLESAIINVRSLVEGRGKFFSTEKSD